MAPELSIGGFLPNIDLPSVLNGTPVPLRGSGGKTTVLVTVHSAHCAGCREYLDRLAAAAGEFEIWDGRLAVLVPGAPAGAARFEAPFGTVLADEHGRLADPASASVLVADRYGQIFHAVRAGTTHDLPSARELEEWLKYLGTLCPE